MQSLRGVLRVPSPPPPGVRPAATVTPEVPPLQLSPMVAALARGSRPQFPWSAAIRVLPPADLESAGLCGISFRPPARGLGGTRLTRGRRRFCRHHSDSQVSHWRQHRRRAGRRPQCDRRHGDRHRLVFLPGHSRISSQSEQRPKRGYLISTCFKPYICVTLLYQFQVISPVMTVNNGINTY
jgi:hypothetical protein